MTQAFDPYHKWLGIPPDEQPPHHYRLLGIKPFEADPDVIQSAADRQMVHLRSFQTGKNAECSQRLLNEVATAKICLLNPEKKAAYDKRLQGELPTSLRVAKPPPAQDTFEVGLAELIDKEAVHSRSCMPSHAEPRVQGAQQFPTPRVAILGAAVAGVLLVLGLVVWGVTGREKPTVAAARVETIPPAERPTAEPTKPATPGQVDAKNNGVSPSEPAPAAFTEPGKEPVKPATEQPPSGEPAPPSNGGDHPAEAAPAKPSRESSPTEEKPTEEPTEAEAEKQRLPAPSDAEQEEAMKLARELYKDEYAKTKTAEERQALAKKILEKAEESGNDAAGAFVLFRLARDMAVQAGDGQAAFEAIEAMAERYVVDAVEMKSDVLTGFAKKARTPADHASLAEHLLNVIDDAVAEDKLAQAGELGKLALAEATKARDKELLVTTRARLKDVQQAAKTFAEFEAAKAALAEKPDDPEANLAAGAYLCFVKGDWQMGLPHLAKGSDAELKAVAGQEISSPPTELAGQLKLGDAWWDLGQAAKAAKKNALLWHAGTWYEQAQAESSGLAKTKIETRLAEIAKIEGPVPGTASTHQGPHLPKIVFGKWFPLLTSPDQLVGWNGLNDHIRYGNGTLETRDGGYIDYPVIAKDVSIRAKAKKVSGQNINLRLRQSDKGYYGAWFNGGRWFGIGKRVDGRWVDLKSGQSPLSCDDFFDFGFSAMGDTLTLFVNGQPLLQTRDSSHAAGTVQVGGVGSGLFTDVAMFIPTKALLVADNRKPPTKTADPRKVLHAGKAKTVYLDDLQPIDFKIGYGRLGKHGDGPKDDSRCTVKGVVPAHSLCTHPPNNGAAHVAYQLGGQFRAFKATATLGETSATPLTFRVFGDGQLLWQSRPLKTPEDSAECDVRVSKIKTLILQVHCPGSSVKAWALWVDPVLAK